MLFYPSGDIFVMAFSTSSHQIFSLFHPDWYESLERYQPGGELVQIVCALLPASWRLARKGSWFYASPNTYTLPSQGWKIHVSATALNCEEILRQTASFCIEQEITFKFLLDRYCLMLSTSKIWPREASGKYITIYPRTEQHFREIIKALSERLKHFAGPYILSDKRYKDSEVLHYRYGGIASTRLLTVSGSHIHLLQSPQGEAIPDQRTPYWNPPEWVSDPFEVEAEETLEDEDAELVLKDGRYRIEEALTFSVCGGVYRACDTQTGNTVLIKEARPYVCMDANGQDAPARLRKEYEMLQKLQPTGMTPAPLDLFWDWEHLFLVEEYIEGPHLAQFIVIFNPLLKSTLEQQALNAYLDQIKKIWCQLAHGIGLIHEMGIVYQDLSLKNIIVSDIEAGEVRFVDLEAAWQEGSDRPAQFRTPGFGSPELEECAGRMHDIYALGAIMLGMLFPINPLLEIEPALKQSFLKALISDFGFPVQLQHLIEQCMHEQSAARPTPHDVIEIVQQISMQETLPREQEPLPCTSEELRRVIDASTAYIRESADSQREDRLFPADPLVFSTNQVSVSHGAAGVIYALSLIDGTVPPRLRSWLVSRSVQQDHIPPGLYPGASGIAWVLWETGLQELALHRLKSAAHHPLLWEAADIYQGASGYGLTCLRFYLATNDSCWLDRAVQVGEWLLQTKTTEAGRGYCWPDKQGAIQLGYAHGASGIALFLLYLGVLTNETRFRHASQQALAFDMSYLKTTEEGYLSVPRGNVGAFENVILPYWFNGSAGVATVLLRFWAYNGESRYLQSLEQLVPNIAHKYTAFPGLFQGLAGLGNFLLDAYHFTGKESYLQHAHRTTQGILLYKIQRPEGIAFPGEQLLRISTDFGTGSAGIALFLQRLAHPEQQHINFNFMLDHHLPDSLQLNASRSMEVV